MRRDLIIAGAWAEGEKGAGLSSWASASAAPVVSLAIRVRLLRIVSGGLTRRLNVVLTIVSRTRAGARRRRRDGNALERAGADCAVVGQASAGRVDAALWTRGQELCPMAGEGAGLDCKRQPILRVGQGG